MPAIAQLPASDPGVGSPHEPEALDLCRGLLAYSVPGMPVAVPHAALVELVALASATGVSDAPVEPLQRFHDVAALGRRYNRAKPTVRQWFHDGLFGPPEERLFRGRGYVASDDAVREFEARTGLRPVRGDPMLLDVAVVGGGGRIPPSIDAPCSEVASEEHLGGRRKGAGDRPGRGNGEGLRLPEVAVKRSRVGDQIRAIGGRRRVG